MLQRFGIIFGYKFVVLYVEPTSEKDHSLTTNTARTTLLLSGEKLPWDDWAYEFREKMPRQLVDFVSEKGAAISEKDHIGNIRGPTCRNFMDLYKVSRYRPAPAGVYLSDEASAVRVGRSPSSSAQAEGGGGTGQDVGSKSKGQRDGEIGNIYHLFEKKGGIASDRIMADPFPVVNWVST